MARYAILFGKWRNLMSSNVTLKRIGERIRALRREKGLTQEVLAERAKMHPTYLSEIENGKANVSLPALASLARGLRVSLADLFPARKRSLPLELESALAKSLYRLSRRSPENQKTFLRILGLLLDLSS